MPNAHPSPSLPRSRPSASRLGPLTRALASIGLVGGLAAGGLTGCGSTPAPTEQPEPVATVTPAELEANAHATLGLTVSPEREATVAAGPLVDDLPVEVRAAVHPRMVRHGSDLTDLYGAMRAGQRDEVARIARAIADEPDLAQAGGPDTVNASIPPAFFERQKALTASARALAATAAKPDQPIGPAFEGLASACAGCHAAP